MLAPDRRLLLGVVLLFGARALAAQEAPPPQALVVNEIHYAPDPSDNEFVELYNRSETTFDLRQFALSDDREEPHPITTTELFVGPGEYAVLVRDAALFREAFPGVAHTAPAQWNALNNGGDAVVLYFDDREIDRVPYTPSWGGNDGVSLERIDPAGPSDRSSNFGSSTAPSGGTPGARNSVYAPDEVPPRLRFAEVIATDTVAVYFDEPIAPSIPASTFTLGDGRVPTATRLSEEGRRIDLAFGGTVSSHRLHVDGARDLVGNTLHDASTYLGYPAAVGDLAINEIMFDPLADAFDNRPNQPEYFELVNRSARGISLRGLFWTDEPDESGAADTTRIGDDVLRTLPPGGFAVVFSTADASTDSTAAANLARAFPEIDFGTDEIVLLPLDAASLGLRNNGDRIRLQRVEERVVADVSYVPGWHAQHVTDAKGMSLERISLTAPAYTATNWTSSVAPHGGTPGRPNSVVLEADAPRQNTLTIAPSPFSPDGDGIDDATRIRYRLDADVVLVRARIYDALGRPVRMLEDARLVSRTGELLWDGRGDDGRRLRIGIYVVLFEALDAAGGRVVTLKRPVVLARPLN